MVRLLAAAADLRASGISWEAVAARLRRAADTCRRWPARYPALWADLYAAAERGQMTEGRAEATAVLRSHLRLEDTKQTRDAAKALLTAAGRDRAAKKEPRDPSIHEFSDKLSHDEVQDTDDEFGSAAQPGGRA
jgi:hypothetical protein